MEICCFACAQYREVHPLSTRKNICVDCYRAPVEDITNRRDELSPADIRGIRRDLERAGIPMHEDEQWSGPRDQFDPWNAVVEALDAGDDPYDAQYGEYGVISERAIIEAGEWRLHKQREAKRRYEETRPPRPPRTGRADYMREYMREYRKRKKSA